MLRVTTVVTLNKEKVWPVPLPPDTGLKNRVAVIMTSCQPFRENGGNDAVVNIKGDEDLRSFLMQRA